MKYLSFLTKLKKARYFFLVAVIMLGFANEVSATWCVVCWGKYGCMAINAACGDFRRPRTSTCFDLAIATNPSNHLYREKDGSASLTIDGKSYKIASDACQAILFPVFAQAREAAKKIDEEKFQKEFEAFLKTDKGFVSDKRLNQISKEINIPITFKK